MLLALAMGATKIFGVARSKERLERVRQIDPSRIQVLSYGEQEVGVRCVAVAVTDTPARLAISVSGPSGRVTLERVEEIAPVLRAAAGRLLRDLEVRGAAG